MCFIQLTLLGIPAYVVIGNTLTLEEREVFHTPMHHLGGWDLRLRLRQLRDGTSRVLSTPAPCSVGMAVMPAPDIAPQTELFAA